MRRQRNEQRRSWLALVGMILLVVVVAGVLLWKQGGFYDRSAEEGLLPDRTAEEIQRIESEEVPAGMLSASINSMPVFPDSEGAGNLRIESSPNNGYDMRVRIVLKKNGLEVYASGGIRPNQHIEEAALTAELRAGEYDAEAQFIAVDEKHRDVGVIKRDIVLTVLS